MIEDLHICGFALIDSVHIDLSQGFTVLSGETGAGKSILIGALSFLLGAKAGVEVIRTGQTEVRVSGTVYIAPRQTEVRAWLSDHGITLENDRVLVRRMLKESGKSGAWIQDVQLTRTELADFTSFIIDIHGQHEHQSLMKVSEHRRFLDSFAGIEAQVRAFTALYTTLLEKRSLLEKLTTSDTERTQKIDLLTFAQAEISEARLTAGEEDELNAEENRLSQYEKLYAHIDLISELLGGNENSVLPPLKKIRATLEHAVFIDGTLQSVASRFESAFYEINDISDELRTYKDSLSYDPERLSYIQERLALIFRLKKKYGSTISDILRYAEEARVQLEHLQNTEGSRHSIEADIADLEKKTYHAGKELTDKRTKAAADFAQKTAHILANLGMPNTQFEVSITAKEGTGDFQRCGQYGFDNIEFLISPNKGSPLRPLAKIASGGELSRVMLALKTVLADADATPTLVFDEIDTGIGGEVSIAVGHHLKKLAQQKQILCITHLANIAVYADTHNKIEKEVSADKTITRVFPICGQERVQEIARMLSGDAVSAVSMEHARTLLEKYAEF